MGEESGADGFTVHLALAGGELVTVRLPDGSAEQIVNAAVIEGTGTREPARAASSFHHLVVAVAASLMATFRQALEAGGVTVQDSALSASAHADIEVEARVPVLKRVAVVYHLSVPGAQRDVAGQVLRFHVDACPVYRSVHPQVQITCSLEFS